VGQFANYKEYINNEARSFVDEYEDDLLDEIRNGYTDVYEFVNDYRVHKWVDNDFIYVDLTDSAEILEQSDNVETDSGLWEGQEPIEAIKTQAFFTYRNDLSSEIISVFKSVLQDKLDEFEKRLEELREELKNEQDEDNLEEIGNEIDEVEEFAEYIEEAIDRI
jgi:gas vesicle protein